MKRLVFCLFLFLLGSFLYADTHTAASLSQSDIQAAIDAADEGDSVQLPAGTYSSFNGTVTINVANLTIYGQGSSSTIIQSNTVQNQNAPLFLIAADDVEMKDFQIDGYPVASGVGWGVNIKIEGGTNFDIHDMIITDNDFAGIYVKEYPCDGVIWNCTITDIDCNGLGYGVAHYAEASGESSAAGTQGNLSRSDALVLGTSDGVYIEDCTFTNCRHFVTAQAGGRYILRYCTLNANWSIGSIQGLDTHGPDEYGRGGRKIEIYENTYIRTDGGNDYFFILSSGSGVIYNNTITGLEADYRFGYISHPCCTANDCLDAFTIRYTGAEATTLTISGSTMTIDCTNDTYDHTIDLSNASYDTFAELVAAINGYDNYTCTITHERNQHHASTELSAISGQDIQSANYIVTHDQPLRDELDALYIWGNKVNGESHNTPRQVSACNDEDGNPYWTVNVEWFESEMPLYTAYTYPHPARESSPADTGFTWTSADDSNSAVTSIKNQFTESPPGGTECNVCWAFATVACFESALMLPSSGSVGDPGNTIDLAEQFLKECRQDGYDGCNNGTIHLGFGIMSTQGIVLESCEAFTFTDDACNAGSCSPQYLLTGYRYGGTTPAAIKQSLYDYGPMVTDMDASFDLDGTAPFDTSDFIYNYDGTCVAYHNETESTNHTVLIVGYGDSPRDRCSSGSSTDYWIVKNSFGTSWGSSGYFYMDAYRSGGTNHDANVGSGAWYISNWETWDSSRVINYYDESGWGTQIGGATTYYGLCKYTASQHQSVDAVMFYAPNGESCTYTIYIYDSFDGTDLGSELTSQSSTISNAGLYTIYLDSPQNFNKDDQIVVVLKMVYSTYTTPIAIDDDTTSNESGKCYVSATGASGTWTDVGSSNSADVCLRTLGESQGAVIIGGTQSIKGTVIIKEEK